ncbi:MAG: GDSL-type esterase/lipase family protein [Planctomycetota bacterium]|jgi:hypothetical protein
MSIRARIPLCLLFLLASSLFAADRGESFLKEGDRWLFVGDSITQTDTYRKLILRVLQHHHPKADIMVGNSAVAGVTSDYKAKRKFTPTVVTIMLGMNDVIHQDWSFNPDLTNKVEGYRTSMTSKVLEYKAMGAEVILMTPTYTDERFSTYFNVACTRRFLEAFGEVVREVAKAENCHWIPVAEELEAYQDSLGIDRHVRPDGVHPYGLGQYQIARSLISRLNLAGKLTGTRKLTSPPQSLAMTAVLGERFMHTPAQGITLALTAEKAITVNASWSLKDARGTTELEITPTPKVWTVPLPEPALSLEVGHWDQLVVEFAAAGKARTCVIDLAHNRVLKMKNGVVEGKITTDKDRPEGKTVGTWKIEERGSELWFSGEVFDSSIVWIPGWPFGRDGVQLWCDLRPAERFGSINPDRDVSDSLITMREEPYFSVTAVPWIRPRLAYSQVTGGSRTKTGYRWHYGICGNVSDVRKMDIRKRAHFAFALTVCDRDTAPKRGISFHPLQAIDSADQMRRLNLMTIVDRKGTFPEAETTHLELFSQ